jgi:hypothetical protein
MSEQNERRPEELSRVDRKVRQLAEHEPSATDLAARVASTSEETAAFFSSGRTAASSEEKGNG